LGPLEAIGVDFVERIQTPGGSISRQLPAGREIADQNFRDMGDKELLPGVESFQRKFIYESFNRDQALARELGAALQVSTLFEPMLERYGWTASGTTALEVVAPNLSALGWEQVLTFREHPGAQEARQMLAEVEIAAVEQEPGDARAFLTRVSQQMTDGLLAALGDKRTNIARDVAEEAAKAGISLIPVAGPFIAGGISATEIGAAKLKESRSGLAALMKLRDDP
jgi:hypothetical protein